MSDSLLEQWLKETDASGKLAAQEEFLLEVTEAIWEELHRRQWDTSQLAEALGKSRTQVTQLLNGSRPLTLRTLAEIGRVLGVRVQVKFLRRPLEKKEKIEQRQLVEMGRFCQRERIRGVETRA